MAMLYSLFQAGRKCGWVFHAQPGHFKPKPSFNNVKIVLKRIENFREIAVNLTYETKELEHPKE